MKISYQKSLFPFAFFIALSSFVIAGCATNARVDFPVPGETQNELVFQCTINAIKTHNGKNSTPHISKPSPFNTSFQEEIQSQQLQKGILIIGKTKTAMHDYPVNLSRKRDSVTLRSSSYGIYYSHDQHLEPSLLRLSEMIQDCLSKAAETTHSS